MIHIDGYDCFRIVETLRLHYTKPSFDISDYGYSGPRVSGSVWVDSGNERMVYEILAKDFQTKERIAALCCGAFVLNPTLHSTDLRFQEPHLNRIQNWLETPLPLFETQVNYIAGRPFKLLFDKGDPLILDLMVRGKLDPEFLVILNKMCPFFDKLNGNFVWDLISLRLNRHSWVMTPVLNDLAAFKDVAKAALRKQ